MAGGPPATQTVASYQSAAITSGFTGAALRIATAEPANTYRLGSVTDRNGHIAASDSLSVTGICGCAAVTGGFAATPGSSTPGSPRLTGTQRDSNASENNGRKKRRSDDKSGLRPVLCSRRHYDLRSKRVFRNCDAWAN